MALSTLKDKGQITLPSSIRRQIEAKKGDLFDFEVQSNKIIMTRKRVVSVDEKQPSSHKKKDLSKWIGVNPGVFQSAEEVDVFIRNERNSWD